jgi:hypothetical protein
VRVVVISDNGEIVLDVSSPADIRDTAQLIIAPGNNEVGAAHVALLDATHFIETIDGRTRRPRPTWMVGAAS